MIAPKLQLRDNNKFGVTYKGIMVDLVKLNSISVEAICGVLPEEQQNRQAFEIDVTIKADLLFAGKTDNLQDTIDYGLICNVIERISNDEKFFLLERFAQRIAEETFNVDDRILGISVSVRKLKPPVNIKIGSTEVHIYRDRP